MRKYLYFFLGLILLTTACKTTVPLQPKRELRGVWIASVANIDWPLQRGMSQAGQKAAFRKLIAKHHQQGINAVFVQIRPTADAFYPSALEPWSSWLTGSQGKSPEYDPLQFMLEVAHDYGMEFHAWLNPYRIMQNIERDAPLDSTHLYYVHPDWFLTYGKGMYFNPGLPEVRDFLETVMMDVVRRYPIDGIHFDDYFYPYKIAGEAFPDDSAYAIYGARFAERDDWRRNNVDVLIEQLSKAIQDEKPHVKFGISPFGVWRNKDKDPEGSETRAGQTNYDDLYADILLWLKRGWIDYVTPQLYWHIGFDLADYTTLLQWWSEHAYGKHVYIGQAPYRIGQEGQDSAWHMPSQMPEQLRMNRKNHYIQGSVFFSSKSLTSNPLGIADSLRHDFYRYPALPPEMPWKIKNAPLSADKIQVAAHQNAVEIKWENPGNFDENARYVLVYRFEGRQEADYDNPANIIAKVRYPIDFYVDKNVRKRKRYRYAVTFVDQYQQESAPKVAEPIKL